MKFILLIILLSFVACNKSNRNGNANISSGDVISSKASKEFIQSMNKEIQASHQLTNSDLAELQEEGFASDEEVKTLKENF